MAQYQSVSVASITAAITAMSAWGLAALSAWECVDPRGLSIEVGVGVTATLISVMWQLTGRRERQEQERARLDEDRTVLIRTLAAAVPARPLARTLPFRRAL